MLRTSPMSVKEIAYHLGFDNPYYFSRLFYQFEGIYPTAFKKEWKLSQTKQPDKSHFWYINSHIKTIHKSLILLHNVQII